MGPFAAFLGVIGTLMLINWLIWSVFRLLRGLGRRPTEGSGGSGRPWEHPPREPGPRPMAPTAPSGKPRSRLTERPPAPDLVDA